MLTCRTIWGVKIFCVSCLLSGLVACSSIPVANREPMRQEINRLETETLAELANKNPKIKPAIDDAEGHFVGRISALKVPVLGGGSGRGVLYDKEHETRTYMDIKRYDVGLGLGTGAYRTVILFDDRKVFEDFRKGYWTPALGAETAAKDSSSTAVTVIDDGIDLHVISEKGAVLAASARVVSLSVNEDLTETGVSEVNIPNKGFSEVGRQGEDAPRVWDRKFPLMAQRVVDLGYDLPLPYGIGLTYVDVKQDMLLDNLEVGFNGGAKEPFEFVGFENANSESNSFQLKLDMWLFPFMNVFGLLGTVDGDAPVDVLLDGNGMLDQLGVSCSGPLPNPLCALLEDQTITLPVKANFSGKTYGIGTLVAGGWNNWFVTLPISFTYADMDNQDTTGVSTTFAPRGGRTFNLRNWGNLSVYGGGNYLNTELSIDGTVTVPNSDLDINYTIDQENKDNWNLIFGGNWDFNKRLSLAAEYNGFIGSRETIIVSFGARF